MKLRIVRPSDGPQLEQAFAAAIEAAFAALKQPTGLQETAAATRSLSPQPLITALSGGADSTALAILAEQYARRHQLAHCCVIIDHGLRPGSAAEAARVAARVTGRGIAVEIHRLSHRPTGGVQAWARAERYRLLTDIARDRNAILLTGHHAGDQAETVYMRLVRGTGLGGLGGMHAAHRYHGVPVLRPMLDWSAGFAAQICQLFDCAFEQDPSNADHRFERVRVRAMLADPAFDLGGAQPVAQLGRLAGMAHRLTARVDAAAREWQPVIHAAGFALFDPASLQALSPALWRRAIGRAIRQVGGDHHAPSQAALARLATRVAAGAQATLGGCQIMPAPRGRWQHTMGIGPDSPAYLITREVGRTPPQHHLASAGSFVFDQRWLVAAPSGGVIRTLGTELPPKPTLLDGAERSSEVPAELAALPWVVRKSIPVLDRLDGTRVYPQVKDSKLSYPVADCGDEGFQIRFLPIAM